MRALLLHFNGIELWEVITTSHSINGVSCAAMSYETIEMMDVDLRDAQRFSSPADALTELHALVARDAAARLRIAARRLRRPRRSDALLTSWLASASVIGASHARSRSSAIRTVRAHRAGLPAGKAA